MKTYLKLINPILCLVILGLCIYASIFNEGQFKPEGIIQGSIPTYFIAKGIFCSSALFILGKILLIMLTKTEDQK